MSDHPDIASARLEIAAEFRAFATRHAPATSTAYARWAAAITEDDATLDRLALLPIARRQPTLLLAAARWLGAEPGDVDDLSHLVRERWHDVAAVMATRLTQTNEIGRCGVLLPLLASLPQPLALLEIGASAGLCLLPDCFAYRWTAADGSSHALAPARPCPSTPLIETAIAGPVPLPTHLPEIVWRAGFDLAPVDLADDDAAAWLRNLVWPGDDDRAARLASAIELARSSPDRPPVVAGDLRGELDDLRDLAAQAPPEATLVVLHSAVLCYLDPAERTRVVGVVRDLPGHWISNEAAGVLGLGLAPSSTADGAFVLALDGRPVARAHGHGRSLTWL
ncbi:DUF2332 family protein [Nocardioides sp.]|uniref:DUF2332 family protein n=1 Tax=Nocardioides sp. TaxID=35761 RepID=UPI003516A939